MIEYCRHRECRLVRVAELELMSERLHRNDLLLHAQQIVWFNWEVQCTRSQLGRPSRSGAPNAPLPPRKEDHETTDPVGPDRDARAG